MPAQNTKTVQANNRLPRTGFTKDIHWIVPALSGIFTGFGLMSIFLQALNYLVDAYLMFAASAIAGNTFMRSLAGAGFPLFARQMFQGMGIQWASTLLGCVALVLAPIPFIFYKYGAKIRSNSAYAPSFAAPPMHSDDDTADSLPEKEGDNNAALASAPKKESDSGIMQNA
jgi:DHA1 family multidrug resistance protein-like MFS transporter